MSWLFQPVLPAAAELQSGNTAGFIKAWTGTEWVIKPVKYWDGSIWITKPVKVWDGSAWTITTPS